MMLARRVCAAAMFSVFATAGFAETKATLAEQYDVVVYGGTSGGVAAAIQVRRMGKTVVLVEPGKHLGGLTSGGLGATDIGNKAAIGGVSREFYQRMRKYYADESVWVHEKPEAFRGRGHRPDEDAAWTFEPHVAEMIYQEMVKEAGVPVVFGERIDRSGGVEKTEGRITSIRMESGLTLRGKMFIDASYEGDLLAGVGVSYHVGREANAKYDETINGVQTKNAVHHQFIVAVDPYLKPGDPASGLLPGVQPGGPGEEGAGDHRVQAYCFRMCTTDVPENQVDWVKPADYDPLRYELVLRNCEAGDLRVPWNPVLMPNRKTDTNNNFAISTDNIGRNYDYPEADYETREKIFAEHLSYQQGLMWALANSPRVPEKVQQQFKKWRPAKDEFTGTNHWPHQLYIREARRMVSDYVMTQHHCQGRELAEHPVGMAAYTMDSHNVQRYAKDGRAWNEGDVQVGGFPPYPIDYRSIRPAEKECINLLVPVCLSASHIAYGSIRMEPVFMVLGQSAATAACQAIDEKSNVQQIDMARLRERLLADKQVLTWEKKKTSAVRPGPEFGVTGTFSIVAVEPETGVCGAAVASLYPAVGKAVPFARGGVGAFCTQHWVNPKWGPQALDLLEEGKSPEDVLSELLRDDPREGKRQLAIIDIAGRTAQRNCHDADPAGWWWGAMCGRNYAVQGNTLTGRGVIEAMAHTFEDTEGSLADKLMAALVSGDCAGGDHRGRLAAGIRVAKPNDEGYWLELQTDDSSDAVIDLLKKYVRLDHPAKGAWQGGQNPFKHPCPDRPTPKAPQPQSYR